MNITESVKVRGESEDNGGKWMIAKRRFCPHTVTKAKTMYIDPWWTMGPNWPTCTPPKQTLGNLRDALVMEMEPQDWLEPIFPDSPTCSTHSYTLPCALPEPGCWSWDLSNALHPFFQRWLVSLWVLPLEEGIRQTSQQNHDLYPACSSWKTQGSPCPWILKRPTMFFPLTDPLTIPLS